jgi:putative membrane protein
MAAASKQATSKSKAAVTAVKETATSVKRQSRDIAASAHELEQSSGRIETSADRTTRLAADRTILAAERTYAAWVRTGLFALASGVGARTLLTGLMPEWLILADSSMLVLFSIFCFAAAVWRQLKQATPPPQPRLHQLPPALLITGNAFLALVSLAALIGIWTPR